MTSTEKLNVVIVGGGVSGVTAARELSKKLDHVKYNLILIDPRPRHVWLPATLRMVVKGDERFTDKVMVPFDRVFEKGKGTVMQDKVVSIRKEKGELSGQLVLASGEILPYRGEPRAYAFLPFHARRSNICRPQFSFLRPVLNGLDPLTFLRVLPTCSNSWRNGTRNSKPPRMSSSSAGALSESSSLARLGTRTPYVVRLTCHALKSIPSFRIRRLRSYTDRVIC